MYGKNIVRAIRSQPLLERAAGTIPQSEWPWDASLVLEGYISRLRFHCMEQLTDVVGTQDDLEKLLGWKGHPRVLAKALETVGEVKELSGVLVCVTVAGVCPAFVEKRWRRQEPKAWKEAKARCATHTVRNGLLLYAPEEAVTEVVPEASKGASTPPPPSAELEKEGLFGTMDDAKGRVKNAKREPAGQPGHKQFIEWWCDTYQDRKQQKYPFTSGDARHVETAIRAAGDWQTAAEWALAYLDCGEPFFAGWPLKFFASNLPRWQAGSGSAKPSIGFHGGRSTEADHVSRVFGLRKEGSGAGSSEGGDTPTRPVAQGQAAGQAHGA